LATSVLANALLVRSPSTPAVGAQSTATQHTMRDLDRLLGYISAHRHGTKIFRPSSMRLMLMSDASYLSRPNAGSVGGDFHHLGRTHDPTFVNGPLSVSSSRIPIVCSSVQEAELAGTFGAAKIATVERQTLADLGYPQPPTIIHCDNEVAVGIAYRTVKPKLQVLRPEAALASGCVASPVFARRCRC
jgi:hypothetical protein